MRYILAILLTTCALQALSMARAEEQRIVIVADAESSIKAISAKEARRAYLGASIVLNGTEIKPLLNQTDDLVVEIFLQKIMFMSAEVYERQLISRSFQGGSRPREYANTAALLTALSKDKAAITFMLYDTAINTPGIRIVGNL